MTAKRVVEACKFWQQERRQIRKGQNKQQLLLQNRKRQQKRSTERQQQGSTAPSLLNSQPRKHGKPSPPAGARPNARNRGADADYFEKLAGEQEDGAGD